MYGGPMHVVWTLWSTTTQINPIDHVESGQAVNQSGNINTRGMKKSNERPRWSKSNGASFANTD